MKPDISEFSYGYALTEELINRSRYRLSITAAPLFPSLLEEGRSGGGYDVHIPFVGWPIFLQFKLSHCMVYRSAFESQKGCLTPPFYRMHLRPLRHSQQHNLLLALEAKKYFVYYAAPLFHLPAELNNAYLTSSVISKSKFIKPSIIGRLPDNNDHHVAFKNGSPSFFCSEPIRLENDYEGTTFFENVLHNIERRSQRIDGSLESISSFANDLLSCVTERLQEIRWLKEKDIDELLKMDPIRQIGYITRSFLGCEILLANPKNA